ncbi:MAG: hypothetical protein OXH06_06625 [Gemmatimonadetes bacterium]|nr:hypothetical protein [Gemmatimonadota bacterium]MDE3260067.1 hypothetical protein [Gemmatimonadota bacterium]
MGQLIRDTFLRFLLLCGLFCIWATPGESGSVSKESFAKGTSSAAEAFANYRPRRIGLMVLASDRDPAPGLQYAGRVLLGFSRQLEGDPIRMPRRYELRLYEAIRAALIARGYEVKHLGGWNGLRLGEVIDRAEGVDVVCAVHYYIKRNHRIGNFDGFSWSSPFEGMHLFLHAEFYHVASREGFYGLEATSIGTEELYANLGKMVVEEPLYPDGYDEHGSPNAYKIAVYQTSMRDLKLAEHSVPIIRTAEGSLDITYDGGWINKGRVRLKNVMRRLNIPIAEEVAKQNSVLARMLEYVPFRPGNDDREYFDLLGVTKIGRIVQQRIPDRRP